MTEPSPRPRTLGAYYFRGGMFTCVPRNVRADLDEMATLGTDVVCLAVDYPDLGYNAANVGFLVDEIHARGMKAFFVPSRMAGITAGAPLTADVLGYRYPHTWTLNRDGTPAVRRAVGVICSFYYPEVERHFVDVVGEMITRWAVDGIVWDEPKSTNWQDFSPVALAGNPDGDFRTYMRDYAAFFSRVNAALKQKRPDLCIVHFDEACRNDIVVEESAKIAGLDYFGVDGKPWPREASPETGERATKVIHHYGERYLRHARAHGLGSFALVENQQFSNAVYPLYEQHVFDLLHMDIDFLVYYYYGFHEDDPERNMAITRRFITQFKSHTPRRSPNT